MILDIALLVNTKPSYFSHYLMQNIWIEEKKQKEMYPFCGRNVLTTAGQDDARAIWAKHVLCRTQVMHEGNRYNAKCRANVEATT